MSINNLLDKIRVCKNLDCAKALLAEQIFITPKIQKALEYSTKLHDGQFRKSGEPYCIHPILVSSLVAFLGGGEVMVSAALLHDVVEDTCCNIEEVEKEFGHEVANLVDGLTKIVEIREDQLAPATASDKLISSALSFRKILLVSIEDVRVLVIKLCDRVHNMLTLDALRLDKQQRISKETLVVYAPIAHRLGISSIKNILEDISFRYLLPDEYKKIDEYISTRRQSLRLKLNNFIQKIHQLMLENGFIEKNFKITSRIKHHYSIYLKMQRKGVSIEEVLDLLAIRILVKDSSKCYLALGILHQNFNPLVARFKDYIALPKQNGYQTIHTTLFDDKFIIETQIRTFDMHKTAEYGVAAHWKYKRSGLDPKLEWLSDLTKPDREIETNIQDFYEFAKDNLYSEDVAVYSPNGDIYTLPRGATALDFAYEIHTDVGLHAKAAYINKQQVPLLKELKNGDIVKIITGSTPKFRCSWINSVKTGKAKNSIKVKCRNKLLEIDKAVAIRILAKTFHVSHEKIIDWLKKEDLEKKVFKIATDSIYYQEVVNMLKQYAISEKILFPIIKLDKYRIKKQKFENIVVYSNHKIDSVEFDYCCHPRRNDDIIGFKKSSSVIVHHKMCDNAARKINEEKEMIFVKWTRVAPNRYKMIVSIENKKGSLAAFLTYLAKLQVNLITIKIDKSEDNFGDVFEMMIELSERAKYKNIRDNIKSKYKLLDFVSVDDAYTS